MSTLDLPRPTAADAPASARPWSLTVEQLAYLALGVASLLAHLWALGDRALHHDETLHAAYSWYLFVGRGYIHDPLLHGPLLYYLGALGYFLFGDGDVAARLMPALAGTALTLTPFLVRRELGRPAALIAAFYLLISPVALYVGRFFRHDIYSVLCEALVFAAIVRYGSTRAPRWLLVGAAAFALMLVNQETSYLFLLIMAAPLAAGFLWRVYRPGLAIVAALGVAVAALIFVFPGEAMVDGAHHAIRDPETGEMQVERPGLFGMPPLATEDNGYALQVRNRADDDGGRDLFTNLALYLGDLLRFFAHPAVVLAIGLLLGAVAALVYLIWRRPGPDGRTPWQLARERDDPAAAAFASLGDGGRWKVALALFLAIYLVFFTAFFTNLIGAVSGVAGSLLYWLAQHNVQRGGQPEHYYLFQLFVYEPLLLLFGGLGLALLGYELRRRRATFPVLLLAWWSFAALGIYTWAGEKMPWLTIHITFPWTLLAAWAAQRAIFSSGSEAQDALAPRASGRAWAVFSCLFAAIVGLSFVLMTAIVGFGSSSVLAPWVVPVAALLLVALLTAGAGLRWGWRPAAAMLAVCLGVAVGLYTARASFRLAYLNGDVPVEPMVYTQTSPDVLRVVRRIEEASVKRGRGLAMPVIYDNETVWSWYLRDFTNAERNGGQLGAAPGPEVMAVFMLQENLDRHRENRELLDGFVIQRYPLRWWFPEDQVYRLGPGWREGPLEQTSLLGQLLRNPFDRGVGERWWRFLMFRDPGHPLGSTDFVIAVRPELADQIGVGLGGDLRGQAP
ncbi:MAG TPA: TIGR03663 family protein [Chloroflexaceae bacterium]|nr:TIGR03663 family protein [Chloroflexaceae bacterium]